VPRSIAPAQHRTRQVERSLACRIAAWQRCASLRHENRVLCGSKDGYGRNGAAKPADTLTSRRMVVPSNRRTGVFYAAPHASVSGAPRPILGDGRTRDRRRAGRMGRWRTLSRQLALVQRRLYPSGCLRFLGWCAPGMSFIALYGLPRGFSNVNICEREGNMGHFWPKPLFRGTSRKGRSSSPGS
jgi:hypothetical protein